MPRSEWVCGCSRLLDVIVVGTVITYCTSLYVIASNLQQIHHWGMRNSVSLYQAQWKWLYKKKIIEDKTMCFTWYLGLLSHKMTKIATNSSLSDLWLSTSLWLYVLHPKIIPYCTTSMTYFVLFSYYFYQEHFKLYQRGLWHHQKFKMGEPLGNTVHDYGTFFSLFR